jgi:hypothetical protein
MDALLRERGARTGVFATAWNPYSHRMPDGWNRRMQRALGARLRRRDVPMAEGSWRRWREEHLLTFAPPPLVVGLARVFRQNAVVVVQVGRKARLVWV